MELVEFFSFLLILVLLPSPLVLLTEISWFLYRSQNGMICALFTPFRIVRENDFSLISKGNLITQTSGWIWHLAPRKNWEKSNLKINRESDIFRLSPAEGKLKPQFSHWRLGTMTDVDWIPNPTQSNKCPSQFTIC